MGFEEDHPWVKSLEDCQHCGATLEVMICVEGSCRECLGELGGYRCPACDWNGDVFGLAEESRGAAPKPPSPPRPSQG